PSVSIENGDALPQAPSRRIIANPLAVVEGPHDRPVSRVAPQGPPGLSAADLRPRPRLLLRPLDHARPRRRRRPQVGGAAPQPARPDDLRRPRQSRPPRGPVVGRTGDAAAGAL